MIIVQIIPSLELAGAEIMCQNLSIELKNMGHKVVVVSLYNIKTTITERLKKEGIKVLYLNKKNGIDFLCLIKLVRIFRDVKPDVVHSHIYAGKYAHIAASMAGVKRKIYTLHSIAQKESSEVDKNINKWMFTKLNVIPVALTSEIKKSVLKVYHIDESDVPIIFNGIPLEKCLPLNAYKSNATRFIHVGRFCEVKNHKNLINGFIKAHEKYPHIKLSLYGDGPLKNDIELIVKSKCAENYIFFCGLTDNVYKVMAESDVFLLPSIYEGMPMTLIEAMATGLPIITTPVGGIIDMLVDKNEALYCDTDSDSIAKAICEIVEDGKGRERMGQMAINRSKIFSAKIMAKQYLDIYQQSNH